MTKKSTTSTSKLQTSHYHSNNDADSVSLHALTGHAVDDAVTVWIHKPDRIRCEPQTETESHTWPEENVEYCGI